MPNSDANAKKEIWVKSNSSCSEIDLWLARIKGLYGEDKVGEFKEEEPILRIFLSKLRQEIQAGGLLSQYRILEPYKRGERA